MPAYLVTLPDRTGYTLFEGANRFIVFASDANDAVDVVQGHYVVPKGADAMWGGATATEIIAETNLTGYELSIAILDATTPFIVKALGNAISMASAVINAGGTAYSADDKLTCVGGTFTRACTIRVLTETGGVIDTVEVWDPGEYTVLPTMTGVVTTGGNGDATVDLTQATLYGYEVFMAQIVGLLNANAQIAAANIDISENQSGARLLTVAAGSDSLGDLDLVAEFGKNGAPVAGLLSTVTDGGSSGDALTVALPAVASLILPRSTPLKSV